MLNGTARTAATLARDAYALTERLPVVWAALADGELDWPRARVFIDVLATTADGCGRGGVAARCCRARSGCRWAGCEPAWRKEVLAADADAADKRREDAEKHADVRVYPDARTA